MLSTMYGPQCLNTLRSRCQRVTGPRKPLSAKATPFVLVVKFTGKILTTASSSGYSAVHSRVSDKKDIMGGGVSSAAAEQMEDMMAYSLLLGRAITCMTFPGILLCRLHVVTFISSVP